MNICLIEMGIENKGKIFILCNYLSMYNCIKKDNYFAYLNYLKFIFKYINYVDKNLVVHYNNLLVIF